MKEAKILKSTHRGELIIGNLTLKVAVLEDGTRILSQSSMDKALGRGNAGSKKRRSIEEGIIGILPSFLSANNLRPFISKDLMMSATNPISYDEKTLGFKADLLPKVCDVYLKARDAGVVHASQTRAVKEADVLMRALATVGITALIDEATGYIKDKKKAEYIEIFKKFVADEAREWQKEFPEPFFDMIYKIYGKDRLSTKNHPQYFGKFISKYVYYPLAGSDGVILEMLKEKNPKLVTKNGTKVRKYKLHSLLEEIGVDALRQHVWRLVGIGEASETKNEFERKFTKIFPAKNQQLDLLDY